MASPRPSRVSVLGLAALLAVAGGAMAGAALRTSATFDEVVLVAAGARAVGTGSRSLIVDQPPLMPLLYGLPVAVAGATRPPEEGERWEYDDRWRYARTFFWGSGNDPRLLALLARGVGILMALGLGAAVWGFARGAAPPGASGATALLAAGLVLLLPDVLAHGAVAYNDLPLAFGFFLAVWALDRWVRRPSPGRSVAAGAGAALALGIKFSALALAPVAAVLVAAEAVGRGGGRRWWGSLAAGAVVAAGAFWLTSAVLWGGDPSLSGLRLGFWMTVLHATGGHPAPAFLLGRTSPDGWWWFFPVAFLLKTPAALHLLGLVAAGGAVAAWREARGAAHQKALWRTVLASPLRAPLAGLAVFGAFLLRSNLAVGFRYALPALPFVAVLVAVGVAEAWRRSGSRRVRLGVAVLCLLYAGSSLSAFPWFLSYTSEWAGPRDRAWRLLADSSLDWGQGLLELERWMASEGVPAVRLSYFGSAPPAGYGLAYRGLDSFFPLWPEHTAPPGAAPQWTVISVTNVHGLYFEGRVPFAEYREREPDRVLAGSLLLYREAGRSPP